MTKRLPYREIRISLPVFKSGLIVIITRDTNRAAANVRKWFHGEYDAWDPDSIDGKTISKNGYSGPVIWMREEPNNPVRLAVLHHEIVHAVSRIMEKMRVPLNYSSEEIYAYLGEYIFHAVMKSKPKPVRKKTKRKVKRSKK